MSYEKIHHDKNKSIKLKYHDIEAIHWLFHVEKWNKAQIADRFKVSQSCIAYHFMTDEQKKEKIRNNTEADSIRLLHDEVFRKHRHHLASVWAKENKKNRPDFNEWRNEMSNEQRDEDNHKKWYEDKKKLHPTYTAACSTNRHKICNGVKARGDKKCTCKCPCHKEQKK